MTIAEQVAPYVDVSHYREVISSLSDDEALGLIAALRGAAPSQEVMESLTDKHLIGVENGEASLTFIGGHVANILSGSMAYLD